MITTYTDTTEDGQILATVTRYLSTDDGEFPSVDPDPVLIEGPEPLAQATAYAAEHDVRLNVWEAVGDDQSRPLWCVERDGSWFARRS